MSPVFKPNGSLDVSTDPIDLPDDGLTRCKNLRVDQQGKVTTRDGSSKFNAAALDQTGIRHIVAQAGVRFAFAGTKLYRNETSIKTGLTDARWSSIRYNSYNSTVQNIFAINGVDRVRIEGSTAYEMGLDAPTAAPTISAGPPGNLTGAYNTKYSYLRKEGTTIVAESDLSPSADESVTCTAQSLRVAVSAPSDSQVTHIRIYRTAASGSTYYPDQDIEVADYDYGYTHDWEATDEYLSGTGFHFTTTDSTNSREVTHSWETEYTDSSADDDETPCRSYNAYNDDAVEIYSDTSDSNLGTTAEATNHDLAPLGTYIAGPNYNGHCFIIYDNLLYYCLAKRPEYWPATYFIEVSPPQFPGKCLVFYNGQPYFLTANKIYMIQGTGHKSFFPMPLPSITGVVNQDAACVVAGLGIMHIGTDGAYVFDGTRDNKFSQRNFEATFRGETVNGVPGVSSLDNAWVIQWRNKIYIGYTSTGYTYPTNCIVYDLESQRVTYYTWDDNEIRCVAIDETNDYLLAGDNSGYVWRLEDDSQTDDDGTAISWDLESKNFTLQTRAHFPRWVKYDIDASDSTCSATGQLMLDGSALQSHTITGNRNTRRRLVTTGNGERLSHRVYGTGVVKIHAVESE